VCLSKIIICAKSHTHFYGGDLKTLENQNIDKMSIKTPLEIKIKTRTKKNKRSEENNYLTKDFEFLFGMTRTSHVMILVFLLK